MGGVKRHDTKPTSNPLDGGGLASRPRRGGMLRRRRAGRVRRPRRPPPRVGDRQPERRRDGRGCARPGRPARRADPPPPQPPGGATRPARAGALLGRAHGVGPRRRALGDQVRGVHAHRPRAGARRPLQPRRDARGAPPRRRGHARPMGARHHHPGPAHHERRVGMARAGSRRLQRVGPLWDPVGYLLASPRPARRARRSPTTRAAVHLLGIVLEAAGARLCPRFADEVLFGPLGIGARAWEPSAAT